MDHIKWIDKQRARRERLGISQEDFAVLAGMSRTHLSRLESHASPVTKKAMRKIEHAFALAAPDALFLLIDYVRIRFKTTDASRKERTPIPDGIITAISCCIPHGMKTRACCLN